MLIQIYVGCLSFKRIFLRNFVKAAKENWIRMKSGKREWRKDRREEDINKRTEKVI